MIATNNSEQEQQSSPKLSTLLNKETPIKEYLPTPVTPASEFPQYHHHLKNNNKGYGSFSVIKPPTTPPPSNNNGLSVKSTTSATTASPTEAKPYPCPECHQTFSRPHNLKSHLTTHSSERPFQCDVCHHHFRRHHDLKRHQKLHTGERPYVCEDCYRSFARLDALNRHRRAEGGTACSVMHQQAKQEQQHVQKKSKQSNRHLITTSTVTTSRPIIPQLHIPNPASQPYSNDNSNKMPPSPIPPPSTHLLPSPNALPNLPITSNNNLFPIYNNKPSPSSPSLYPPRPPWSPYLQTTSKHTNTRFTLPPLPNTPSSPPPSAFQHYPSTKTDQVQRENEELKRDIDQLRAMAQREATALKSRIHDLEVENKVLRSLIQDGKSRDSSSSCRTGNRNNSCSSNNSISMIEQ
ncbi:MAG: hypothetical protein EXX96DRAFT_555568 [Benjaminiella poitrasii]|nr:MAG: hypothetical protein EXX96DRAFT_555568 [Benjaminiella poitrasii]